MSEWKSYTLGDLVEKITKGTTPSTLGGGFVESGINFIKSEAVGYDGRIDKSTFVYINEETHEKLKRSQLQQDDILFSMAGIFLGKNAIVREDFLPANTNQALAIIRLKKDKTTAKFVHYFLRQADVIKKINSMSGQSAQPNINFEEIKSIEINLPDLNTQTEIVSILSSLDDKIELNLQMNQTLETMAQTIFKEWFVNFNFPGFDGELVDGLPKGWRVGKLRDVLELVYGKALKADTRAKGNFPVIGSSGIVGYHNEYLVNAPGIVIGRKGTIGEVIWINENFFPIDTTFYVNDLLGVGGLYFHYFLLKGQEFKKIASDSAVPGLNRHQAMNNVVTIPDVNLLKVFNSVIQSIFKKKEVNTNQNKSLIQIRDSLLPKLMTGKIEVKGKVVEFDHFKN